MRFAEVNQHLLDVAGLRDYACGTVIAPNVDHMTKLEYEPAFKTLYATSDYIFADDTPIF